VLAGGTGHFVSLAQALPNNFESIKTAFRPSDVDVKVLIDSHNKATTIDELRRRKAVILKAFNKLRVPNSLEELFDIKYN
jgi:hypothetical protein